MDLQATDVKYLHYRIKENKTAHHSSWLIIIVQNQLTWRYHSSTRSLPWNGVGILIVISIINLESRKGYGKLKLRLLTKSVGIGHVILQFGRLLVEIAHNTWYYHQRDKSWSVNNCAINQMRWILENKTYLFFLTLIFLSFSLKKLFAYFQKVARLVLMKMSIRCWYM